MAFSVTFPKPSISMNPVGKVTWGEDAGITCSISTQNLGGTFILLKTPGSFKETQSLSNGSANFSIPNVGFVDGGSYLCLYEKMGFSSEPSDSVRLSVAGKKSKEITIIHRNTNKHTNSCSIATA